MCVCVCGCMWTCVQSCMRVRVCVHVCVCVCVHVCTSVSVYHVVGVGARACCNVLYKYKFSFTKSLVRSLHQQVRYILNFVLVEVCHPERSEKNFSLVRTLVISCPLTNIAKVNSKRKFVFLYSSVLRHLRQSWHDQACFHLVCIVQPGCTGLTLYSTSVLILFTYSATFFAMFLMNRKIPRACPTLIYSQGKENRMAEYNKVRTV